MAKLISALLLLLTTIVQSQTTCTLSLSGSVTDIHTGEGLENAEISLKNTKNQSLYNTYTDAQGTYRLENLCEGTYQAELKHSECKTKVFQVSINRATIRNFSLEHHEKELQNIITVGKAKKQTTTSIENKLTKSQINQYSDTNLGTALTSIAGVNALSTGNNIVKPVIHGLHSSRVPVLNNGIRQEDQQWGVEHAPDIDINIANSISVIKGAGALQYAGDATGGVILIEPKKLTTKDTLMGNLLTSYISNGRGGNISANIEKGWKNGFALRLQGTYKRLGDLSAPDYILSNTGIKENDFSAQLGYHKHNWGVEGFFSFYGTESGILKSAHIGNLENLVNAINSRQPTIINDFTMRIDAPKQKIQHNLAKFDTYYNFDFGKLTFVYGYQFNNRKEYDIRRTEYKNKPSLNLDLTTHDFNLNFDHAEFNGFKGKIGVSYVYQKNFPNAGTGVSPLIPYYEKNNFGIYLMESYKVNQALTLEGGFRYDYQKIDALKFYKKTRWRALGYDKKYSNLIIKDTGLNYLTNPVLEFNGYAATLGAVYKLGAVSDLTVNYSLSSRNPNPSELFSDGLHHSAAAIELGDLELKNEKSNKFIASLNTHLLDYRLNIDFTIHYNYIKDFINQVPTGAEYTIRGAFPVWQYLQTNAEIYGIDVTANYNFIRNFTLGSNFSYLRGNDKKNNIALISMPPVKWVNSLEYKNNKWNNFFAKITSTSVFKQSHYPDYNFSIDIAKNGILVPTLLDISSPPAAYQLFDLATGFTWEVTSHNNLDISLTLRNIFDTSYRDYMNRLRYYADETGRNFILKLQYNF
ncbi:TonB-dependent receptor [Apibacter raozihei]|uniref:TonB-dependent receptor n=1 Tax=Apibacter raozihei TaxID=2500547 RepID=UPI000FE3122A|nr:TonB-dependent receptor [Apibacter raozihei]